MYLIGQFNQRCACLSEGAWTTADLSPPHGGACLLDTSTKEFECVEKGMEEAWSPLHNSLDRRMVRSSGSEDLKRPRAVVGAENFWNVQSMKGFKNKYKKKHMYLIRLSLVRGNCCLFLFLPKSHWVVWWLSDLNYPDQWCPTRFFYSLYLLILWPHWDTWQLIGLKRVFFLVFEAWSLS